MKTRITKQTLQYMAMVSVYAKILKWINKLKPARYFTRVYIIVQNDYQRADQFANEIDNTLLELEGSKVLGMQFTTDAKGRQTCNIVYRYKL